MNLEQLQKNVGHWMQLEPIACRLDEYGFELPSINDDWIVQSVSKEGIRLSNVRTGHFVDLGPDHIYKYTSNAQRQPATNNYGFLSLHVQVVIQGVNIHLRPNGRPGERVPPMPVSVQEKRVDFRYPTDSGLQSDLAAHGFRLFWCNENQVTRRVDMEGWEVVIVRDKQGIFSKFRLRTKPHDQILLRRFDPQHVTLTNDEWLALRGIASAAALGQTTATQAVISKRLIEIGLIGYDETGHLVITPTGRLLLDRKA